MQVLKRASLCFAIVCLALAWNTVSALAEDHVEVLESHYGMDLNNSVLVKRFHHDRSCTPEGELKERFCGIPFLFSVDCWCTFADVTRTFVSACAGRKSCAVSVENSVLDTWREKDPCPNVCKVAIVKWRCAGSEQEKVDLVAEGEEFRASCP